MIPHRGRAALAAALLLLAGAARAQLPERPKAGRGAPIAYLAMGDSTAVGVGGGAGGGYPQRLARRLEASGVPVKLAVVAASGATIADLRRDQLPEVMAKRPALVTIGVGINDLMQGRKLADFARDLEVVADLVRRTKATVVLQTLPDLTFSPAGHGAPPSLGRRLEAYNATIARVAERHGFVLSDVYGKSRRAFRDRQAELFAKDGFHPSSAGYEVWTEALWPDVERAVVAPRVQARTPAAGER
ncbi:GDSL-type esterase/lipase family protein [Anaeromyxobacter sp. Fw109-5]|uniref:SGNH/GDSL hydrolase family protein n=1 Tax=Anaeromyxobacter sp. (strain Fw109-5) TaxID=404589 RepID=UPI0000ED7A7A|nr:GDSL-type esterase/lipase family protein [Anaeromyxobacter sp. Fw109-5]ABS24289.1 lipolytic protein G-D-S-L family [Anaeromyxobacter sp. Fw109-5]